MAAGKPRRAWVYELLLWGAAIGSFGVHAWLDGEDRERGRAPPPRVEDRPTLRLVTWNVGGAAPRAERRLRDELLGHVVATLNQIQPDVVLLQEVANEGQVRRIAAELDRGPWRHVVGPKGLAILTHGVTLEQLDAGDGDGALPAMLVLPSASRPLGIAAIHADAFSAGKRNRQIGRAMDELLELNGLALILAGDLNLDVDLDKRRDLVTDDAYRDVETYNYVANHLVDATLGTGATAEPDRRLDYVFFHPGHFELEHGAPWPGHRQGDMDHDPVVVDLKAR